MKNITVKDLVELFNGKEVWLISQEDIGFFSREDNMTYVLFKDTPVDTFECAKDTLKIYITI